MLPQQKMLKQVWLLVGAQALVQTASIIVVTVGALIGSKTSPWPELATAPIAGTFLGTALATVPASLWMAKTSRRIGFLTGALLGVLGGITAMAGAYVSSFAMICLGTLLVGAYQGFAQFYRFAASEVSSDAFRPKAIALVLGGGIVAAFAGPNLARWGSPLLSAEFAGSFLILAVITAAAIIVLLWVDVPKPMIASVGGGGRPISAIVRQPTYLVALFGAITGFGVMVLAMSATPLAMAHHHHGLDDSAFVIQMHVLGMFVPSFFTGSLIVRFGVLRVMLAGVGFLLAHVATSLTGFGLESFVPALVLLGMGWNFLYVGGTTLLTQTYTAAEKGRAQGANDFLIVSVGAAASFGSGALLQNMGWQEMNLLLLPWLGAAALAILWLGRGGGHLPAAEKA